MPNRIGATPPYLISAYHVPDANRPDPRSASKGVGAAHVRAESLGCAPRRRRASDVGGEPLPRVRTGPPRVDFAAALLPTAILASVVLWLLLIALAGSV